MNSQLEGINALVSNHNNRQITKYGDNHDEDTLVDLSDVKWMKKPVDKCSRLLEKLRLYFRSEKIEDVTIQHNMLVEHANMLLGSDNKFVTRRTFIDWMDPNNCKRKNRSLASWEVIDHFTKRYKPSQDFEDEVIQSHLPNSTTTNIAMNTSTSSNNVEIGNSELLMVMNEKPRPDDVGELVSKIRYWRKTWDILENPERRKISRRISDLIKIYESKCLDGSDFGKLWTSTTDEGYSQFKLKSEELSGFEICEDCAEVTVVDGRKVLDKNIPHDEPAWHHKYSVNLRLNGLGGVYDEVYKLLPMNLFPEKGETDETMMNKMKKTPFLDVTYNIFQNKNPKPLNETVTSMQPARRTCGVVTKRAHIFVSDLPPGEEEGNGDYVVSMYGYLNCASPTNLNTSLPMKNVEYAMLLSIWEKCWPWLSKVSRESPPTGFQFLIYHRCLQRRMGRHRDGFRSNVITNLMNGYDVPWGEHEPKQLRGSSVVIFTRGRPMRIKLYYATIEKDLTQQTKEFISSDSFQMVMGDGYITVLDPIDDMLMLHSVEWEGDGDEMDHREAWVYRWLEKTYDYYIKNCRIRRTKNMMNHLVRDIDDDSMELEQDMFSK